MNEHERESKARKIKNFLLGAVLREYHQNDGRMQVVVEVVLDSQKDTEEDGKKVSSSTNTKKTNGL